MGMKLLFEKLKERNVFAPGRKDLGCRVLFWPAVLEFTVIQRPWVVHIVDLATYSVGSKRQILKPSHTSVTGEHSPASMS